MQKENFDVIIDFAIEREKEAVIFYQDLEKMVKFQSLVDLLRDFQTMEQGHVKALESIRCLGAEEITVPDVPDMKISDYTVQSPPTSEMEYEDILVTAMKREEASKKMYTELAEKAVDPGIKQTFLKLASEEAKHKLMFEDLYEKDVLQEN